MLFITSATARRTSGPRVRGHEDVEEAQLVHLARADDRDERRGAARRMQRPRGVHDRDRRRHGERRREPGERVQELPAGHADDGREDVPAEEVARLGERAARRAEEQHGRSAERTDHERAGRGRRRAPGSGAPPRRCRGRRRPRTTRSRRCSPAAGCRGSSRPSCGSTSERLTGAPPGRWPRGSPCGTAVPAASRRRPRPACCGPRAGETPPSCRGTPPRAAP